jgi:DnaJ-like protein
MAMRFGMGTRRAALDGLERILDAGALEDLFTGSDVDAVFMYDLLVEAARGRGSACYWEICRTARRRGVSPEYVIDRAAVLLASIDERRRIDAYRILGVAGLASPDAIRHRWLEFAKTGHPDVGGDPARFRRVKQAYELLRDPQRRGDYERYWLRALGPIERAVPRDEDLERTARREGGGERRLAMVGKRGAVAEAPPAPEPVPPSEPASVAEVLGRVRSIVRDIDAGELAAVRARLASEIERLEAFQRDLTRLLGAKRALAI